VFRRKLKYGFHYTWSGLSPKSEIVVVYAHDLEEARDKVRVKVRKVIPDVPRPTCHWITMPQDFHKIASKARKSEALYWWKRIRLGLLAIIFCICVILLTSCSVDRFIQSNRNFRKKITAFEHKLTGAKVYHLEAVSTTPLYVPKTINPIESVEGSWESPVFLHP
jgi:hypothetical protein